MMTTGFQDRREAEAVRASDGHGGGSRFGWRSSALAPPQPRDCSATLTGAVAATAAGVAARARRLLCF